MSECKGVGESRCHIAECRETRVCQRPVTAPTPDAVAQARKKYTATLPELDFAYRCLGPSEIAAAEENTECAWAEVIAAVRAECAAKVRDMRTIYTNKPYSDFAQGWHEACDAITRSLEAQP